MNFRWLEGRRVRNRDLVLAVATGLITVLVSLYVALRSRPMLNTDYEAFLFVGSRLAQGDRAYVDVWDNKDPVTYWLTAVASYAMPTASHIIEVLWLVVIGVSTFALARAFRSPAIVAILAGVSLGPLAVLTLAYFPGATEIPGVALTLAALAMAVRGHDALSGVVLGLLVLTKFVFIPVAGVMVAVWILRTGGLQSLKRVLVGFLATNMVLIGTLLFRGEFFGYVETLMMNVTYSNAGKSTGNAMSLGDAVFERASLVLDHGLLGSIIVVLSLFAIASIVLMKGWTNSPSELWNAWTVTIASALTALFVLALTAKSPHHMLLLSVPSILACLFTISVAQNNAFVARSFSEFTCRVTGSLVTLTLAVVVTGIISPSDHKFLAEYGLDRSNTNFSRGPIVEWLRENRQYRDVPIQFVGQWMSVPITDRNLKWVMGCRFLGQGTLATELILNESLECLDASLIVFVRPPALPVDNDSAYSVFWRHAMEKLTSEFDCTVGKDFDVCVNRTLSI